MKSMKIPLLVTIAATLGVLAGCAAHPAAMAANGSTDSKLARCEQATGSRIRPGTADCTPVGYPFKSFSADELQATGEMDLIEALRQMDPAFR